jgi:hypothetical protein
LYLGWGTLNATFQDFKGSTSLSLYRVYFKWKEKEIQLTARSLDLTHPYFVSIKDLVFSDKKKIIINPAEDDIIKAFGNSKHLMIPFQTVLLIEELDEEGKAAKLRRFTLVEGKRDDKEEEQVDKDSLEDRGDVQS